MSNQLLVKFGDLGSSEAFSLLASACEKFLSKVKKNNDWKKIIVDTGEFFLNHEKKEDDFYNDLNKVLSRDNLTKIAKDTQDESGYSIKILLYKTLMQLMAEYEIPQEIAETYSSRILHSVLEQLKTINPEKYKQYFLEEWREDLEKSNQKINNKLDKISQDLVGIVQDPIELFTAEEMDKELKASTRSPSIGVDFFVVDDEHFQEEFANKQYEESVHIRGRCREETIYCILNELCKLEEKRPIYIVKNSESWNKLFKGSTENNIYIPWFYADEIPPIKHNTNIFVSNENTPIYQGGVIELRPRTQSTIIKCLQDAGLDYDDAHKLFTDTHGLYIPMKKRLFQGVYPKAPEWMNGISEKAKKICLLLGKWEETEGDKLVIEILYEDSYDHFIEEIQPYTIGEDPFLYTYKRNSSTIYYLASIENTWACIDVSIDEPIWEKYIETVLLVLSEAEKIFTYDNLQRIKAQIRGEKLFWSKTLRKGMLTTLLIKGAYKTDYKTQNSLNNFVKHVLDGITTEEQWSYIADFWPELCEIAPETVLDRMEGELEKPTGLLKLFEHQTNDFILGRNPYINILWGTEQFLVQRKYFSNGFRWLLELDKKAYPYKSNSPKDTFAKIFCTWHNYSVLETAEEKINAAENAMEIDEKNTWDYLFDSIDNNGRSIIGYLFSPKYREHEIPRNTTNHEMNETQHGYLRILLLHTNLSVDRWIRILNLAENTTDKLRAEIFDQLLIELGQMPDLDVITIKNYVRQIIYRHRYYSSSSWTMAEDDVTAYEELLNKIHSKIPEYEYSYLFEPDWDFPLIHPIPFGENNEQESNGKAKERIIREKITEFQENGYRLSILAELCSQKSFSPLGQYIAKYWDKEVFVFDTFIELISVQESGKIAIDYLKTTKVDNSIYTDIITKLLNYRCSDEVIVEVYRLQAAQTKELPLIEKENETLKKLFWQTSNYCNDCNFNWAINEIKNFGTIDVLLKQIFERHIKNPFSDSEIYDFLEGIENLQHSSSNQMTGYYAEKLLKVLQESFIDNPDKYMRIVQLEIYFSNLIGWHNMKCFHHIIKISPELYAQLIAIVFRRDDGQTSNKEMSETAINNVYSLYQNTKFCPTEENGTVQIEKLEKWIEKFLELLNDNHQASLSNSILGRLFSFSPTGSDGHLPCEAVRIMIEKYGDDDLLRSFESSIYNQRGVFTPSAGKEELQIAEEYLKNAEYLALKYKKTARIFYDLYNTYKIESEQARKDAENGLY